MERKQHDNNVADLSGITTPNHNHIILITARHNLQFQKALVRSRGTCPLAPYLIILFFKRDNTRHFYPVSF